MNYRKLYTIRYEYMPKKGVKSPIVSTGFTGIAKVGNKYDLLFLMPNINGVVGGETLRKNSFDSVDDVVNFVLRKAKRDSSIYHLKIYSKDKVLIDLDRRGIVGYGEFKMNSSVNEISTTSSVTGGLEDAFNIISSYLERSGLDSITLNRRK